MKCNNCNTEILSTFFYCPSCDKCTRIDTPKKMKNSDSKAGCSSSSSSNTNSGVGQKRFRSFAELQAEKGRERIS
jgi:hypothetical protein